jgi:hypothetical protein
MNQGAFLTCVFAVALLPRVASADPNSGPSPGSSDLFKGVAALLGNESSETCPALQPVRCAMYGGQVADAFVTGAAVRHGSIGRTPFGTTTPPVALITQGAFDALVGALTRRWGCTAKIARSAAVGASAIANAVQTR